MAISPRWNSSADDQIMTEAAETWVDQVTQLTQSLGTADPFLYLNFAAKFQKPMCTYGAENVAFLQSVSANYSGGHAFESFVPGGFKLSSAC